MRIFQSFLFCVLFLTWTPASAERLEAALAARLAQAEKRPASIAMRKVATNVTLFYRKRKNRPLWISEAGLNQKGKNLLDLLKRVGVDGLRPEYYGSVQIDRHLAGSRPPDLAKLEVLLTRGLVRLARDLGQGRISPRVADRGSDRARAKVDMPAILPSAAAATDLDGFIQGFRPKAIQYQRMQKALRHYRGLADRGGWKPIPQGAVIKPGGNDKRIGAIRDRLMLWGDVPETEIRAQGKAASLHQYDAALVAAVKSAQTRFGLPPDGVIGRETITTFNVPVAKRIQQLVLNMERWRWLSADLGQLYVFVNLADFRLHLVKQNKSVFTSRVIVGGRYHKTPIFSEGMTQIIINPYWNVPESIARKELLPIIKADPEYMQRADMWLLSSWSDNAKIIDPYDVEWEKMTASNFPYRIRQGGIHNPMGRLKFVFPNPYAIFLHDTPEKSYFQRTKRYLSHGCIRVEDSTTLASLILDDPDEWPRQTIEDIIDEDAYLVLDLAEPVPVHIVYLTAWVDRDNRVHFRSDIYDRDHRLVRGLRTGR